MDLFEKILLALGCLAAVCVVYAVAYGAGRLSGENSHPFPVVIPHDRITGTRGEKIPPGAAFYCTRDLKNCTHVGLPGEVHKYHFMRNEWMDLCAKVEFVGPSALTAMIILFGFQGMLLVLIFHRIFYGMLADRIVIDYNRRVRKWLLMHATGHEKSTFPYYASKNTETMMTYTPEDGFRLRLLWKDAPVFPAWKFDKAEAPGTPLRLAKEWVEVARLYATKGVRYDIGYDVGIEWREGGMRVWIGDTAYDSAPMTPGAPNNVSE